MSFARVIREPSEPVEGNLSVTKVDRVNMVKPANPKSRGPSIALQS